MPETSIFGAGARRVAVAAESDLLLSQTAALGPSLALLRQPNWLAFGFGAFGDGGPAIRYAAGHSDGAICRNAIVEAIGDILQNQVLGLDLSKPQPGLPVWLERLAEPGRLQTVDIIGPVPRFNAQAARDNAMWMGRFLTATAKFQSEAGVVLMLRPFAVDQANSSAIAGLKRYFESAFVRDGSVSKQTKQGDEESLTRGENWRGYGEERRRRALDFLQECARSGAWWASVRCFGKSPSIARRVASLYWSCLSAASAGATPDKEGGRSQTRYYENEEATGSARRSIWSRESLEGSGPKRLVDYQGDVAERTHTALAQHGLDPVLNGQALPDKVRQRSAAPDKAKEFYFGAIMRMNDQIRTYAKDMVLPEPREMLVSGERLSSLFQLPVEPSPAMEVLRGFGYCYVSEDSPTQRNVVVGSYGAFSPGIGSDKTSGAQPVSIDVDDLAAHALIVGATGSGKTTTVVSLLKAIHQKRDEIRFAILEGAKREYRAYRKTLGIKGHFDLMGKVGFLELNIFDHPEQVSPESHISQIASLFEATLEMPVPLPALMREALGRAYAAYHDTESTSPLRSQHPIRFWLMRAVLEVAEECGYKGELGSNIDAALRTRVRALAMGASGQVLRGREPWSSVAKQLVAQNNLLELESIADRCSRSFVMSLFVLYFRYAIESARRDEKASGNQLRNVLVLEEAHRIIGKPSGQDSAGAALEYFGNLLGEVRAYGCGVVISDQSPSRLIDDAMRNTNTKVLMRLVSGEDVAAAVQGAGLPDGARGDIPQLQCGQAILIRPKKLPALVKIEALPSKDREANAHDILDPVTLGGLRRDLVVDEMQSAALFKALRAVVEWEVKAPKKLDEFRRAVGPWISTEASWRKAIESARQMVGCECSSPEKPLPICAMHGKKILYAMAAANVRDGVTPAEVVEPFQSFETGAHDASQGKAKQALENLFAAQAASMPRSS